MNPGLNTVESTGRQMKKCVIKYSTLKLGYIKFQNMDGLQFGQKDHNFLENSKADAEQRVYTFQYFFLFHRLKSINTYTVQKLTRFKGLQTMVTYSKCRNAGKKVSPT